MSRSSGGRRADESLGRLGAEPDVDAASLRNAVDVRLAAHHNRRVYELFKFLHILSMFVAVTLMFAPDIVLFRAARAQDVRAMRRIGSVSGSW